MPDPANPPDDEAEVIGKLSTLLESHQRETAPQLRSMHSKTVACLAAEFRVPDALPARLAHGLFARPGTYAAWVRFSNALARDDREPDIHGFAVKILGVSGTRFPEPDGNPSAQDILLIDTPIFFTPDVQGMYTFMARKMGLEAAGSSAAEVGRALAAELPADFARFAALVGPARPPLEIEYWSCVPYRLGPHVVKYSVGPPDGALSGSRNDSANCARESIVEWLTTRARPASFDLCVQPQDDPVTMPVEDATVRWTSPFHKVAELRIPPQTFDTPERDALGERLAFDPWRTLPEHEPLGSLNRARKPAYWASASVRHEANSTGEIKTST